MSLKNLFGWLTKRTAKVYTAKKLKARVLPRLAQLEGRDVPSGYAAIGAGPGGLPKVAIRVDIQDQLGGNNPPPLGSPSAPRVDGRTDLTTQIFLPFQSGFRGGVHTATGNFDGSRGKTDPITGLTNADQLVTATGAGASPHVIVWRMAEAADGSGRITTNGKMDSFYAFDPRFRGGVNVTSGDLDGDGVSELICAAGAGGGPHVRIFKFVNGRFQLADQFFAYDASFTGGVSVASSTGYTTTAQYRQLFTEQLPDDFVTIPDSVYISAGLTGPPGTVAGIPEIDRDFTVPAGGTEFGYTVLNRNPGTFDTNNNPLPYVTVGAGAIQYHSGNPTNALGNIIYEPNKYFSPGVANPDDVGQIYFAKYTMGSVNNKLGLPIDVTIGPFIRATTDQVSTTGNGSTSKFPTLTVLQAPEEQSNFKSVLITGAGPGGGPHVKMYDFDGSGSALINRRMTKSFFAFDPNFRGGVNVALGDAIADTQPISGGPDSPVLPQFGTLGDGGKATVRPGRFDYTKALAQRPTYDTTENSSPQQLLQTGFPFDTAAYRRYAPEIIVAMASGGSTIRIFSDANVKRTPTGLGSALLTAAPSRRITSADARYVVTEIDAVVQIDPTDPLGGFSNTFVTTDFNRGLFPGFSGGINPAIGAFTFNGSANEILVGQDIFGNPGGFSTNPALGQSMFGNAKSINNNTGGRVRTFNQLTGLSVFQSEIGPAGRLYAPHEDYDAFNSDGLIGGAFVSYGFGGLSSAGTNNLDIVLNSNSRIPIRVVTDPIFVDIDGVQIS